GDQVGDGNVGDRPFGLQVGGDAGVAFGADAGLEADRRADADLAAEGRADFRQVVGEGVGVTRAVAAVDRGDRQARQFRLRIQFRDLRVVPLLYLSEVDFGEPRPAQVGLVDAGDVEADAGRRQRPRDRHATAAFAGLFRGHRRVRGAE